MATFSKLFSPSKIGSLIVFTSAVVPDESQIGFTHMGAAFAI